MRKIGVCGDLHLPFGDPVAVELTMRLFKDYGVDEIVLNGDLLDMYGVNMHGPKHPDIIHTLEDELVQGRLFLETLRKEFPKAKIHYIFGNHEDRLERFILKNTKVFHNILRIEKQLMLENLDISFQYYNSYYELVPSKLRVQHSPPSYAANAASVSLKRKIDCTYIYGCTHRPDYACHTTSTGEVIEAYMLGWLGNTQLTKESKRVFSFTKGHENWGKSAAVVDIFEDDEFEVQTFNIRNDRIIFRGKRFEI